MGLSFLNGLLLGGMALVAVPVVLHLLMRRKPVPHAFPALRFLQLRARESRRRLRLQHLLLLLVRIAALCLLVLALARPVLRGAGWLADREGPVAVACVIDTAPRMQLRQGNRTRLDQVRELADALFAKLPRGSSIAIVDTSGGGAAFAPSLAAATDRLARLDAAPSAIGLTTAIADAARLLEASPLARRELYVFTDLSQGAWEQPLPSGWDAAHPDVSLLFVDVAATAPQNFALQRLELSAERVTAGTPLTISAVTRRVGPAAQRSVALELRAADGSYTRRGEKPIDWQEGTPGEVSFELAGLEPGIRQGRVLVEGGDALAADNAIDFTIEVGPPARVLAAGNEPVETTGLFFVEAVAPLPLVKAGRTNFTVTLLPVAELADQPWDDFAGIVLLDPPPLPAATWDLLGQWVGQGGGLLVWLGPAAGNPAGFNSAASEAVLGGRLERVWRNPGRENFLAPAALDHPVLAAFRRVGDSVPWQDFPVFRHWEFRPSQPEEQPAAERSPPAVPLLAFRNGLPAVLEKRLGQGRVLVATTPVSQAAGDPAAWNLLATGFEPWPFVMLANEMLTYAVAPADDLNIFSGAVARLRIERRDLPTATVRTPLGDTFPAAVDQQRGTIAVTATRHPGSYGVRSGGEVGGFARGFSVRLPPSATDFRRLAAADLPAVLGAGHRVVADIESLQRDVALERVGTELSGWLLLLAAAVLAADWGLANRFYAPREGADPEATAAVNFAESLETAGAPANVRPPPVPRSDIQTTQPPPLPPDFSLPTEQQA